MLIKRFELAGRAVAFVAVMLCCFLISPAAAQTTSDQYGLAAGHYERQEYEQAIAAYRDLIEIYPSTRQAAISYFFLGESFVQLGDYQSAVPAYEIFLKRLPQDNYATRARFRLAECAYRLNWDSQAVSLLEEFVQDHNDDELVDYSISYLGELRLKRSEPQLALSVFESALRQYPNSENAPRNRFGLARALQAVGQQDQALKFYQMLATDPNNEYFGRAKMQIGVIQLSKGELDDSRESLTVAVESLSGDGFLAEAKYWLAKSEMAADNFSAALEQFTGAIERVNNVDLKVAMLFDGAITAAKLGESKTALDWLNQLRTTWPQTSWSDDALQLSIELNYQEGNLRQALTDIAKFETEFSDHEKLPLITEYKGRIQYDQQEFTTAVATFDALIQKHLKDKTASDKIDLWLYLRGLGELGLKDYEKASESFATLDMHGKENQFIAAVLLAEASCAVGMEKPERAIAFFEQYLATNPSGPSADRARSDLAIAHAQAKSWPTCQAMLDEFERAHTDVELYLDTELLVGEIALKEKRFDLAEKCFADLAKSSNPRKFAVRGLSGLAWVRLTQGNEKSAVTVFEQLVREHGESSLAAEAALACGKYFEQHDKHSDAIEMYRHVLSHFSETNFVPLAKLRLSYNLVKSGAKSQLQEAEQILQRYLGSETQLLDEAKYQLAWVLQDSDRITESQTLFQQIVDEYPGTRYWTDAVYRVAQHKIAEKNFTEATELVDQVAGIKLTPELKHRFDFLRAQVAVSNNQWATVETTMLGLLASTDDQTLRKKARYWLAESLFHLDSWDKAKREFARLISTPDSISESRLAWASLRTAQCAAHLEDWSEAMDLAIDGRREFDGFSAGYEFDYVIGRSHAAQGRLTEARKSYRAVIESVAGRSTKTAAMSQWRIGETYFHQQDYERAIEAFYRVDSLYVYEKWRAAALVEAGKCQEHLGNWNHAIKLYQQLIEKFPNSEFRVAAQQRMSLATRQAKRIEDTRKN